MMESVIMITENYYMLLSTKNSNPWCVGHFGPPPSNIWASLAINNMKFLTEVH